MPRRIHAPPSSPFPPPLPSTLHPPRPRRRERVVSKKGRVAWVLVRAGCTYPFPKLLLDLVLSENVLVDLFAHDEVEEGKRKGKCGGRGRGSGIGEGKGRGVSVRARLFREQMRCVRARARLLHLMKENTQGRRENRKNTPTNTFVRDGSTAAREKTKSFCWKNG